MKELDRFDLGILRILQMNNMTSQRDLGNEIGLSAAAVNRRIRRMEEIGVIQHNVAVVNREHMGNPVTLLVEVMLDSEKLSQVEDAKKKFRACPEIQQCYYVTGGADFILIIVVSSMADYERLTQAVFFSNDNIKSFKTFVAMDIVKIGLDIPLK